jgi:A/G-specific adenine glycosylase
MLEEIVKPLLMWYDGHARVLPWREQVTPYRVWVSEIMLQQTRVEAVKPFYERFMDRLPDIQALAECPDDALLKLWEGLGYYNRVKNMKKAAQILMDEYQGEMPDTPEKIRSLPGIGPYTAGAVLSIAYGKRIPAVDGNVLRVFSRVLWKEEDITRQSVKKQIEEQIFRIMPEDRPGDFNQALMELGATVCVPNGPAKCSECPLKDYCIACQKGRENELPKKAPKKERRMEEKTVLVIQDGERAAIKKRPEKGLLSGVYELPNLPGHLSEEEVLAYMREQGFDPVRIQSLGKAKHIFSHVEWRMIGYRVQVAFLEGKNVQDFLFVEPKRTEEEFPIPAAFSAYAAHLQIKLGQEKYE